MLTQLGTWCASQAPFNEVHACIRST